MERIFIVEEERRGVPCRSSSSGEFCGQFLYPFLAGVCRQAGLRNGRISQGGDSTIYCYANSILI